MQSTKTYVRTDSNGVMRVGETRVMLDSIIVAFNQGHSAETIQQQYPALGLEEVYGAIAHYLANKDEVDSYLQRQDGVWEHWRQKANEQSAPVLQRLRTINPASVPEME